jgi:zinc transport system ATP-binding protein
MTAANPVSVLSVRRLTVRFGNKTVIHDLTFDARCGENLAIIGPNGAGKTVLLRALLKQLPYEGVIEWTPEAKLGYVPQQIAADRQLPLHVSDLLAAKARLLKLPDGAVREAATIVGLGAELLATRIGVLSGGQFQKALITFALLGDPNVLLVDEPTASLDELAQEHVYELLEKLRLERNLTVLLVSHDLSVVYQFANKVLCLSKGKPCFGSPRDILTPETLAEVYSGVPKFYQHVHHHDVENDRT